jgi:hypothetical protein
VTFEEDNASDRLVGITIQSCQGATCAIGTLKRAVYEKTVYGKPETVVAYTIDWTTKADAVNIGALVTSRPDGKLRFEMSWMVPYNGAKEAGAKDGEKFTVGAYFGGDGANTFERSFVGACASALCGVSCKLSPG